MEKFLDLEYRGEGNCAIVFANPQTNQVYRLVKYNATRKLRKLLQNGTSSMVNRDVKNIQGVVKADLDNVISYMNNVMRPLLSERYIHTPTLTVVPKGFAEKAIALAGQARPAHRQNSQFDAVDSDIQYALVLPDCCFVHRSDYCGIEQNVMDSSNSETDRSFDSPSSQPETLGITDGPQGAQRSFSCCSEDSQYSDTDYLNDSADIEGADVDSSPSTSDGVEAGSYAYQSGDYSIDSEELEDSAPHICDPCGRPNNRKVAKDDGCFNKDAGYSEKDGLCQSHMGTQSIEEESNFTLSIEIKAKKALMTKSISDLSEDKQVCRFCMHQHLKRKSGKWPQTSSYCPLDLFSGNKHRMKHALFSLIKTPQNNLKICKNGEEVYGSDIRKDLSVLLRDWFPVNPNRRQKLISVFLDLVIEILLDTADNDGLKDSDDSVTCGSQRIGQSIQKCDSSSFVHYDDDKAEGLPQGCVLERIYSLQSLDDLDIEGIFPLYKRLKVKMEDDPSLGNRWCINGPYDDVSWLFGHPGKQLSDLDPESDEYAVLKVKRFLVSKTLQDCSIIVAIKPVMKSIPSKRDFLRFGGDLYDFSISVVDLDPKPFEKVKTYYRQASDIAVTFAEAANKMTSHCESNNSS